MQVCTPIFLYLWSLFLIRFYRTCAAFIRRQYYLSTWIASTLSSSVKCDFEKILRSTSAHFWPCTHVTAALLFFGSNTTRDLQGVGVKLWTAEVFASCLASLMGPVHVGFNSTFVTWDFCINDRKSSLIHSRLQAVDQIMVIK